jgi:hypothetical protein
MPFSHNVDAGLDTYNGYTKLRERRGKDWGRGGVDEMQEWADTDSWRDSYAKVNQQVWKRLKEDKEEIPK